MSWSAECLNAIFRKRIEQHLHRRLLSASNLMYRLSIDGTMDNMDQRITSDLQVALDGICCVLFGNLSDYLAYPLLFTIMRFSLAFGNAYSVDEMWTDDSMKPVKVMALRVLRGLFASLFRPFKLSTTSPFSRNSRASCSFPRT